MQRPQTSRRRRGFTLVELLVVIGIIAVLIGILLPALNKARQQAQIVACLSNLRSCGQAFMLYANENHGSLPFPTTSSVKDSSGKAAIPDWFTAVGPLIGKVRNNGAGVAATRAYSRVLQDPIWDTFPELANGNYQGQIKEANRTYKMNTHLRRKVGGTGGYSVKLPQIKQTQQFVLIGDAVAYDLIAIDSGSGGNTQNGRFSMQMSDIDKNDAYIFLRHKNTANICFVDGHAENCNYKLTPLGTQPDGKTAVSWDGPASGLAPALNKNFRMWYSEYVSLSGGQPVWPLPYMSGKTLDQLGLGHNPDMPLIWSQPPDICYK